MMFFDLQFPLGRHTFWPFTVTFEIGVVGTTSQHWQLDLGEVLHLEVPPGPMLRDIFLETASLKPTLGAVFFTTTHFYFVFCH